MKKTKNITYWISTIFLSIAMLAGGIQQLLQIGGYTKIITDLHYPMYLLSILGAGKILGIIAILLPRFVLVKEWAYAGFFFAMSGAFISHLAVGQSFVEALPALILMIVIFISWSTRPLNRKINFKTATI